MKGFFIILISSIFILVGPSCLAINSNQLENKQKVLAFYNAAFNQLSFEEASKYLGKQYIQHSQHVADGAQGLKDFIQLLRDKYPKTHIEIKQVFVDGNYVILLVHFTMKPDTPGLAIIDIFKLKKGKIIEHWGVSQEIANKSANSNGMF